MMIINKNDGSRWLRNCCHALNDCIEDIHRDDKFHANYSVTGARVYDSRSVSLRLTDVQFQRFGSQSFRSKKWKFDPGFVTLRY